MSRTGWEDEVEDMKDKGAIGTDDDFKKISRLSGEEFSASAMKVRHCSSGKVRPLLNPSIPQNGSHDEDPEILA